MSDELESQNQMTQLQEPLIDRARRYWRQHLPQEFQRLKEKGELEAHLASLVDQYEAQFGRLIGQGLDPAQAIELTQETLFPQEEPDLDDEVLSEGEEPYQQPENDVAELPAEVRKMFQPNRPRVSVPANPPKAHNNRKVKARVGRKRDRVNRRQNRR